MAGQEDDFLTGPTKPTRYELDARLKRALGTLTTICEKENGGSVSERALITEAVLDLVEKYERGNGKYRVDGVFKFADK